MVYGDKRDYPKIDIQEKRRDGEWKYTCSTTWSNTCEEAAKEYCKLTSRSEDRVRAVRNGTEESRIGRQP